MANKNSDYDGWMLRLIEKAEDIMQSYTLQGWLDFATQKIEEYHGREITPGQLDKLAEYQHFVAVELPESLGFKVVEVTQYRDAKGRFTKEVTEKVYTHTRFQYMGEKKHFMKASDANDRLQSELVARGVRKQKEGETSGN